MGITTKNTNNLAKFWCLSLVQRFLARTEITSYEKPVDSTQAELLRHAGIPHKPPKVPIYDVSQNATSWFLGLIDWYECKTTL